LKLNHFFLRIHKYGIIFLLCFCSCVNAVDLTHLQTQNNVTSLLVNNEPFLILGGELANSSASTSSYMKQVWPKLKAMNLNTVLVPVYWELIEPEQGRFDFTLLDELLRDARANDLKLVLLWFGSWKNSMSSYVPGWVKRDAKTYPRVLDRQGKSQEILSPFSRNNLQADLSAYTALVRHLKKVDEKTQTVLMLQVENEIAMLPDARDFSRAANEAYQAAVPPQLMNYLQANKENLVPGFYQLWKKNGFRTQGNWVDIFGEGVATEEIFIAWHLAVYTNEIAAAGKAIYPLPTFVNAALNHRPGLRPGEYPSGGPLPHLMDIWKAATPQIDLLTPDFYNPDFQYWSDLYVRQGDPLFIPEIRYEPAVIPRLWFAFGNYNTLGFSPFSIDTPNPETEAGLAESYRLLNQLSPLILKHQQSGNLRGVLLDKSKNTVQQGFDLGVYRFTARHDHTLGWTAESKQDDWPLTAGLIIQLAKDEFLVAGTGIVLTFASQMAGSQAGIEWIEEGEFVKGKWVVKRYLNGDENHQGRHLRIPFGEYGIQKLKLYTYPQGQN
jgi:beta-galactosidase GanA